MDKTGYDIIGPEKLNSVFLWNNDILMKLDWLKHAKKKWFILKTK